MLHMRNSTLFVFLFLTCFMNCQSQAPNAVGPKIYINPKESTLKNRVQLPPSFHRLTPADDSFAYFLQNFPLKPHLSKVHYYNGTPKYTQEYHLAVLDIDTGKRDLQQCADAVIRLRAEYLFQQKDYDNIAFHFTNGFLASYDRWRNGERIKVVGNTVSWYPSTAFDDSYKSFRKYLTMVFSYAGTLSLNKELVAKKLADINIGDVFIQGGSPGHAVIVVDMAIHESTGEKIFLMAQSYMPAQDIHIIKKNKNFSYGPWYTLSEIQVQLQTPEWTFRPEDLKTF